MMVSSMDEALNHGETIVIGNGAPEFRTVLNNVTESQVVIDLVRITDSMSIEGKYDGICW